MHSRSVMQLPVRDLVVVEVVLRQALPPMMVLGRTPEMPAAVLAQSAVLVVRRVQVAKYADPARHVRQ